MQKPIIFDLESKYTLKEKGYDKSRLGVSVLGFYDYQTDSYEVLEEADLPKFFKVVEHCSYLIGYNIVSFDIPVLQSYYAGDLASIPVFDLMTDIKNKTGKRFGLNDLASATLGEVKSGNGLSAIFLYREGKLDELKQYCYDDVVLTKKLFDYGVKHNQIFYPDVYDKTAVSVNWSKYMQDQPKKDINLTLPF
ncbi:MAG: hypothetical protein KatS3mg091_716 [Patescibacteria group bacterium]|nr:MAG: hypothetical protein KatS3mg091_716 [Patescibacteria group bacterium]